MRVHRNTLRGDRIRSKRKTNSTHKSFNQDFCCGLLKKKVASKHFPNLTNTFEIRRSRDSGGSGSKYKTVAVLLGQISISTVCLVGK